MAAKTLPAQLQFSLLGRSPLCGTAPARAERPHGPSKQDETRQECGADNEGAPGKG